MASPIGHALVGLTAAAVTARVTDTPSSPALWLGAFVAAGLPDLDLALGLVGLKGPRFHRVGSHSLVVIGPLLAGAWGLAGSLPFSIDGGMAVAWAAALISHPLLDVWTTGPTSAAHGYGISLLWPLSRRRWFSRAPICDTGEALMMCRSLACVWHTLRPEVARLGAICGALIVALAVI